MVEEAYMPLTLFVPNITDEKFQELCQQYSDFRLEYTEDGELICRHYQTLRQLGRSYRTRLRNRFERWICATK